MIRLNEYRHYGTCDICGRTQLDLNDLLLCENCNEKVKEYIATMALTQLDLKPDAYAQIIAILRNKNS